MKSYFKDRKQCTKVNGATSKLEAIRLGVPQGSILGPLLFIIFINDLVFDSDLFSIIFADDTSIYISDYSVDKVISKFKLEFEKSLNWINFNRLYMNLSKTKFMFISRQNLIFPFNINIQNDCVEVFENFRLLGCIIDNKLTFEKHVEQLVKNVNVKLFAIKKIFFLESSIKLQFLKTFLLPHFDYCFLLFIYMKNFLIDRVELEII